MAGVAEVVDARHVQEPCVLRTVRTVAAHAAFCLHRGVLVDKRSTHLRVALGADQIRIISGTQVAFLECAVHVVAICALDQTFVHLMMERHVECRFGVGMALEAESRLRSLEQRFFLAAVNAVAAGATEFLRRVFAVGTHEKVQARMGAEFVDARFGQIRFGQLGNLLAPWSLDPTFALTIDPVPKYKRRGHRVPVHLQSSL